ncbi:MAG: tRNA lysidine(34) synthetase TilS [Pirellulales bacterium]|nr:tRNA lysidine(34) synthetase TilS [Pirellulales bacterium]
MSTNILHPLESRLLADWPADRWRDVNVLVAVSGGPDSVAMLRALIAIRTAGAGRLIVGHFNHQLRGAESDADEQFVRDLAQSLGLDARIGKSQVQRPSEASRRAWEEVARDERYGFLTQSAGELGARYIAMAHTADDQVETVLHRLIRGTGIGGLAGIPRARHLGAASLIRPLLDVTRGEVLAYLQKLGQDYRVDRTNAEPLATRNRIRLELLPLLREGYNANVDEAIRNLARLAGEAQQVIGERALELAERAATRADESIEINCRLLTGEPPHLVRECLVQLWRSAGWHEQAMGFSQWQMLAQLATADVSTASARMLPGGIRAERKQEWLRLTRT